MVVVWISLPRLLPNLFAKRSLLSRASAVGKPIGIEKATQDKTRPSTTRVKVILDLMGKHPKRMRLQYMDEQTGHNENSCRLILKKNQDNNHKYDVVVGEEQFNGEKFKVAYANNNDIAMVEAINNDGDRVVDTCQQSRILRFWYKLDGITSDWVVHVVNLEYDQASDPKIPAAGVLSGKDPSLAMIEDPGQANKVLKKSYEPEDVVSRLSPITTYDIDLGNDMFDKDDDDDMIDILFEKLQTQPLLQIQQLQPELLHQFIAATTTTDVISEVVVFFAAVIGEAVVFVDVVFGEAVVGCCCNW
ncbi:hypothetical protein H5410_013336 [Solanum commersonii]|uniref:Uncharacterized protein n=1 Tax=Solanum commersonii TaxID=4109 RepID=A0A9J6AUA5_SOLCO|nr:hypothetical protein H5410_013336 [Solanum commersonii]